MSRDTRVSDSSETHMYRTSPIDESNEERDGNERVELLEMSEEVRDCSELNMGLFDTKQRRATKIIQKLRNISYEMRLKECGLTTLETRRLRD